VLKQNTSGKADVWKKFSLVWDTRKKGESGADVQSVSQSETGVRETERLTGQKLWRTKIFQRRPETN